MFDLLVIAAAFIGGAIVAAGFFACIGDRSSRKRQPVKIQPAESRKESLHWLDHIERRGLGDLLVKVNHIGITVADVGRSLAFYTDVLGFQQIQRPNFDRHGAWLTMGNVELHLIKGIPAVPSGKDLIVSHIALDTDYPKEVLNKLIEMKVAFRQNVSVPDADKARDNLEENFDSDEGKIAQYFVRDPDGYYLELSNGDILTKFCLFQEGTQRGGFLEYEEGVTKPCGLTMGMLFKISVLAVRLRKRARRNLQADIVDLLEAEMKGIAPALEVDENKLAALVRRKRTYCDVVQSFSAQQLRGMLMMAGNQVPQTILLVEAFSTADGRVAVPPQYFFTDENDGQQKAFQPEAFSAPKLALWRGNSKTLGRTGSKVFTSKSFQDVAPARLGNPRIITNEDSVGRSEPSLPRQGPLVKERLSSFVQTLRNGMALSI